MFHYFDGVTDETWLDNSTPLVKNADKYDPDLATEFSNFCDYYNTLALPQTVKPEKIGWQELRRCSITLME